MMGNIFGPQFQTKAFLSDSLYEVHANSEDRIYKIDPKFHRYQLSSRQRKPLNIVRSQTYSPDEALKIMNSAVIQMMIRKSLI